MTVTALTVGAVFGSFIESSEAGFTQNGSSGSGGRWDQIELDYYFELFPTVEDSFDQNTSLGFFANAVENFTGGFFDVDDNLSEFDELLIVDSLVVDSPDTAKKPENVPLTLDLMTKLLTSEDKIEYILTGTQLTELGITELALIIDGLSDIPDIEPENAVNSLEYIIEKQLLGFINTIRVSGPSSRDLGEIFSSENEVCDPDDIEEECQPVSVQSITRTIPEAIPESDTQNSLLVLGILSAGWGLKRRFQVKS